MMQPHDTYVRYGAREAVIGEPDDDDGVIAPEPQDVMAVWIESINDEFSGNTWRYRVMVQEMGLLPVNLTRVIGAPNRTFLSEYKAWAIADRYVALHRGIPRRVDRLPEWALPTGDDYEQEAWVISETP